MTGLSTRGTDFSSEVPGSPFTLPDVSKPTAIVYVDGFNLYRRALENTPYKWLDIDALASMLLADYEVIQIRYFTANIKSLPHNPMQAHRQQTYLRALATNSRISIHISQFRSDSDYAESLRLVSEQLGKTVGVIFPTDTPSKELLKVNLQIVRQIREGVLVSAQLPIELLDVIGVIRKPSTW